MPDPITDVDVFTATVNAPLAGEAATGASVKQGMQALANRALWLARDHRVRDQAATAGSGDVIETFDAEAWTSSAEVAFNFDPAETAMAVGDRILAIAAVGYQVETGTSTGEFRLAAVDDTEGTPTSPIPLVGSDLRGAVQTVPDHGTLIGIHTVTEAGFTRIELQGRIIDDSDGTQISVVHAYSLVCMHIRAEVP